jgi:hypothetical protein
VQTYAQPSWFVGLWKVASAGNAVPGPLCCCHDLTGQSMLLLLLLLQVAAAC